MRLHIESLTPSHCICNTSIPVGKRCCNQRGIPCSHLCTFAAARHRNQHRGDSDTPCTHTFLHDTLTVVESDPRSSLVPNICVLSHQRSAGIYPSRIEHISKLVSETRCAQDGTPLVRLRRWQVFSVARLHNQHMEETDMRHTHTFLHDTLTVVGSDPRSSLVPNIGVLSHQRSAGIYPSRIEHISKLVSETRCAQDGTPLVRLRRWQVFSVARLHNQHMEETDMRHTHTSLCDIE